MALLTEDFFARATVQVARDLLGATLRVRAPDGRWTTGRIVETEAYGGAGDQASHAAQGPTRRSRIMFGPPGRIYIYLIYGMHHCLNFVTEAEGVPGAVLVRALEPIEGKAEMAARRGLDPEFCKLRELSAGPGRLCQALGLDLAWNGLAIATGAPQEVGERRLEVVGAAREVVWRAGPRIGISQATTRPLRFVDPDSPCLSR